MYSEKPETLIWKNIYMHPYVPCRVIYYNKNLEATQVPIRWVDKIVVYLNNLIQCSFKKKKKKKETLAFATAWIDLETIMLSEISQSEKDKYHRISLICGI